MSGSAMRRRASAKVQYTSASKTTTRKTPSSLIAVFRPSLSIPNTATGSMVPGTLEEQSAESVAKAEEQEDDERHDHGDERDHGRHRGPVVAHSIDLPRAPSGRSRSAMR